MVMCTNSSVEGGDEMNWFSRLSDITLSTIRTRHAPIGDVTPILSTWIVCVEIFFVNHFNTYTPSLALLSANSVTKGGVDTD